MHRPFGRSTALAVVIALVIVTPLGAAVAIAQPQPPAASAPPPAAASTSAATRAPAATSAPAPAAPAAPTTNATTDSTPAPAATPAATSAPVPATTPAPPSTPEPGSLEWVDERLKRLAESTESATEDQKKALGSYQKLREALIRRDEARQRRRKFDEQTRVAPQRLKDLQAELDATPEDPKPSDIPASDSIEALSTRLVAEEEELGRLTRQATELNAEPQRRATRRTEIPKAIVAAKERLAAIEDESKAPPPEDETPDQAALRSQLLAARAAASEQELAALEHELQLYDQTEKLLSAERDLAIRKASQAQKLVKLLRARLDELRSKDAEQRAALARKEATNAHPSVQRLADENASIAEARQGPQGVVGKTKRASDALEALEATLARLREDFSLIQERESRIGLTHRLQVQLRKERSELPDTNELRRRIRDRELEITAIEEASLERRRQRNHLADRDSALESAMALVTQENPDMTESEREAIAGRVAEALDRQRSYLDALLADYQLYLSELNALNSTEEELLRETEQYRDYIAERILWIRSSPSLRLTNLYEAADALRWLFGRPQLAALQATLLRDAVEFPGYTMTLAVLLVLVAVTRRRLRNQVRRLGEQPVVRLAYSFWPTLWAAILTLVIACVWPLVLAYLGWRLGSALDTPDYVRALSIGLWYMSAAFLTLELFRQLCRPHGLAEAHFGWPRIHLDCLRRNLRWLMVLLLPIVFIVQALEAQPEAIYKDSLGRIAFILGCLITAIFLRRVLRPDTGILSGIVKEHPQGWIARLSSIWYPAAVVTPLAIAAAAAIGYYYTAMQIAWRMEGTLWFGLSLVVVYAVVSRWVLVMRRRLTIEAAQAAAVANGDNAATATLTTPEAALAQLDEHSRRLLQSICLLTLVFGGLFIWADVLPALGALRWVVVWNSSVQEVVTETVNGVAQSRTVDRQSSITLADVAIAVVLVAMTYVATQNLPGILEIVVLRRLSMETGARYAIVTLFRYGLLFLGCIAAAGAIGLAWSQVQWLVAGISVGLGFGLQEIFANLVCGLILLFERPIRVGDTVTVNGKSGNVNRINMRATTIMDWDGKELIIPNKAFVTGEVINWTLSSTVTRLNLRVGVAYGTDVDRAQQLILKVCREAPSVLAEPPPQVIFESFGDSSLNFIIYCHVPTLDKRLPMTHHIHREIDRAFKQAGIEIPFPQRDLHMKSGC